MPARKHAPSQRRHTQYSGRRLRSVDFGAGFGGEPPEVQIAGLGVPPPTELIRVPLTLDGVVLEVGAEQVPVSYRARRRVDELVRRVRFQLAGWALACSRAVRAAENDEVGPDLEGSHPEPVDPEGSATHAAQAEFATASQRAWLAIQQALSEAFAALRAALARRGPVVLGAAARAYVRGRRRTAALVARAGKLFDRALAALDARLDARLGGVAAAQVFSAASLRVRADSSAAIAVVLPAGSFVVAYRRLPAPEGWVAAIAESGEVGFIRATALEARPQPPPLRIRTARPFVDPAERSLSGQTEDPGP